MNMIKLPKGWKAMHKPTNKELCEDDLAKFLKTYFPFVFTEEWTPNQINAIKKIQNSILTGEMFSAKFNRGEGKTSLCLYSSIWALLFVHRKNVVVVVDNKVSVNELIRSFKMEHENNELWRYDFPTDDYRYNIFTAITKKQFNGYGGGFKYLKQNGETYPPDYVLVDDFHIGENESGIIIGGDIIRNAK